MHTLEQAPRNVLVSWQVILFGYNTKGDTPVTPAPNATAAGGALAIGTGGAGDTATRLDALLSAARGGADAAREAGVGEAGGGVGDRLDALLAREHASDVAYDQKGQQLPRE
jgi:hypothetical protein